MNERQEEIKRLEELRYQLLSDSINDKRFSKIYLFLSPVTPILVSLRNENMDPHALLLNLLMIGVPLGAISVFLKHISKKEESAYKMIEKTIGDEDILITSSSHIKKKVIE